MNVVKPLCDTTMTPRNPRTACGCATYESNLGPCDKFEKGSNGNCVYCDHALGCHPKRSFWSSLLASIGNAIGQAKFGA